MKEKMIELRDRALADLKSVNDLASLENWEVETLGRKSPFNLLLKGLGAGTCLASVAVRVFAPEA